LQQRNITLITFCAAANAGRKSEAPSAAFDEIALAGVGNRKDGGWRFAFHALRLLLPWFPAASQNKLDKSDILY
jgi:hypothetical protein